ncbi:hypothetical protein [Mycobacterium sp. IDR2000157661]|uniref:hypothetical protein n=1 Tax=Mycobacterium sp. IDR2000157661 TaxID=2867005 RepID=UPI001EE9BB19|nr:hypothetical protein [Mycobacterium sp. IDR2000157661]ULE33254.1 hypothetical protein K3G64_24980 [Mycobacterium sp. IDR2000157661]
MNTYLAAIAMSVGLGPAPHAGGETDAFWAFDTEQSDDIGVCCEYDAGGKLPVSAVD